MLRNVKQVYNGFGQIYSLSIEMDGVLVDREIYHRGDAVAVVLYDPTKNRVILTNQIRPGVLKNESERTNCFELVAGMIDGDMTAIDAIKAEALEEVGYNINPQYVMKFYTSPGAYSERIHLFYAEVSYEDKIALGGGNGHENENIEIYSISLDLALASIDSGIIDDAKTIIGLQWLKNRRR